MIDKRSSFDGATSVRPSDLQGSACAFVAARPCTGLTPVGQVANVLALHVGGDVIVVIHMFAMAGRPNMDAGYKKKTYRLPTCAPHNS